MDFQKLFAGAVSLMSGAQQLREALGEHRQQSQPRRQLREQPLPVPESGSKGMVMRTHQVRNIKERVKYIQQQIAKARNDPRFRAMAVKIVSKKCGNKHCIRERDYLNEVKAIYDYVRKHVRYVRDPLHADLFQHPQRTLEFGGGDCFPEGTLFLSRDGLVPVEGIQEGDEIHDGERWVEVIRTWDRGLKTIIEAELNNGRVLRLSDNHKVLVVPRVTKKDRPDGSVARGNLPGKYDDAEEVLMGDLRVSDDLLQPRSFDGGGTEELDEDEAFLIGAYLAEGCRMGSQISISGVANRKGIRERVESLLERENVTFRSSEREVRFKNGSLLGIDFTPYGRIAMEKNIPHFRWGPKTVATVLSAMEQGDGGWSTSGKNMVYSTVSIQLAAAYAVLKRMEGVSTGIKKLTNHGGLGKNPIYRVTSRESDRRRPWAKIRALRILEEQEHCYDLMTTSGRVYLPESDVITLQCDDYTITLGAMLEAIGYPVKARVIQTTASDDYDHIYLMVGISPHSESPRWLAMDASVNKKPGWQPPASMVVKHRDFPVS